MGKMPAWLAYDFKASKRITRYYILPEYGGIKDRCPVDFYLQGSNGGFWTIVDSRENISWNGSGKYFVVKNPNNYTRYRLYITKTNRAVGQESSGVVSICQFKMESNYGP